MKRIVLFLVILSFSQGGWAQVVLETNPASISWQQINTDNFRVLFPTGFDVQALRMANTLEKIRKAESRTLGSEPRRISVILQTQSSQSNGFVSILPRRSEFFTMPPQDYNFIGTNDWLNLLAAHEFRHIVQYQHATRGFNRFVYYLFGSTTLAAFSQAAAPQWFWEGDAVATETAFTPSGRGRLPNFGLVFRTNLLEGRTFNYHKQYLRSYKHNIPDHYVLGYYMVSHLRRKSQDPEIWGKITARSWNVPFIPFAFSNSIHKHTGKYVTGLFEQMATDLKKEWQAEVHQLKLTPFEKINNRRSNAYTDYSYPQSTADGSVLVMKRGIGDIDKFVVIDKNKKERKVFTPGFVNDAGMLSMAKDKIVWSEYGYDPRWGVRDYSQIKIFSLSSDYKKRIGGRRARLSGAALSPDAATIVAVESDVNYKNSLQLFDVARGRIIKTYPNPENVFYSMPRWSDDGKAIVVVKTDGNGKRISIIDPSNGASKDVLTLGQENVGHPVLYKHYIFFNSPITGIDNIFVFDLQSKTRHQVTSSKYAAYNPAVSVDGKSIYYNEQTRDGLDVVSIPFDPSSWQVFSPPSKPSGTSLVETLVVQEGRPHILDSIPQKIYPARKYSKFKGIVNPYNWGAFVTNDLAQINVGVVSRDILSTIAISAGYMYDINEGTSFWNAGLSYQGFYPILDLGVRTGERETEERYSDNELDFSWEESSIEGGLRLPLQLTNSKYSTWLSIGNAAGFTRTTDFRNVTTRNGKVIYDGPGRITQAFDSLVYIYKDQLDDGDLIYNHASFSFSNLLKRSRRDFLSPWGQTLDLDFYNTPYGGDFEAEQLAARTTFYFPGFFKHHFLYTRFGYQKNFQGIETDTYIFSNKIAKPRGHSYPTDETFTSFSVNYALPLWYPDIAIGPLLNLQRIKANFFYDYGQGTGTTYYYKPNSTRVYSIPTDATYQSLGVETTFDFNVMRFLPKFELGFRTTYRLANEYNSSGVVFELVIGNIAF
ncbi:MAG TPA: hypothetical protein VE467_00495 [Chryseolinea sp.]|nr:hypothetical protein [Chryseolinea sp.]